MRKGQGVREREPKGRQKSQVARSVKEANNLHFTPYIGKKQGKAQDSGFFGVEDSEEAMGRICSMSILVSRVLRWIPKRLAASV